MTATILQFSRRRQRNIIVVHEPDDGWFVIRGSHGWLHGDAWQAFADAQQLASDDAVAIVVRQ
jgi:hypothetical protein